MFSSTANLPLMTYIITAQLVQQQQQQQLLLLLLHGEKDGTGSKLFWIVWATCHSQDIFLICDQQG